MPPPHRSCWVAIKQLLILAAQRPKIQRRQKYNQKYNVRRGQRGTRETLPPPHCCGRMIAIKNTNIGGAADKIPRSKKYNQKYGVRCGRRGTRETSPPPHCRCCRIAIRKILTSAAPRTKYDTAKNTIKKDVHRVRSLSSVGRSNKILASTAPRSKIRRSKKY